MRGFSRKAMVGGILALSLVLAGTGYAYWTDTLNVTTKATTGELDVTFVDLGLYAQYSSDSNVSGWSIYDGVGENPVDKSFFADNGSYNEIAPGGAEGANEEYAKRAKGYNEVSFDAKLKDAAPIKITYGDYNPNNANGSDTIKLAVKEIYPGYAQFFRSDIINQGNIAAKLGLLKFEVTEATTDTAKDMIGIALSMDHDDGSGVVYNLAEDADADDIFTVGGTQFVRLSALNEKTITEFAKGVILNAREPMTRMDLFIGVAMDPDAAGKYTTGSTAVLAENDDGLSEKESAKISINLGWDQFNAEAPAPADAQ